MTCPGDGSNLIIVVKQGFPDLSASRPHDPLPPGCHQGCVAFSMRQAPWEQRGGPQEDSPPAESQ